MDKPLVSYYFLNIPPHSMRSRPALDLAILGLAWWIGVTIALGVIVVAYEMLRAPPP